MKIDEYITKMKSLADNLELAGSPLPIDLCNHILVGLDDEYTPIVTQLIYQVNLNWLEFSSALLTF